jgi:hypothetical protein
MKPRTKVLALVAFGVLVAIAAGSPFLLMLLPNPEPVRVDDVASQPPGAYITTRGATYAVFPYAEKVDAFPSGSLTVDGCPTVWVRSSQLDSLEAYGLYTMEGAAVAVERDASGPGLLAIRPQSALAPGPYFAELARDGLYGGTDYIYFQVATDTTRP